MLDLIARARNPQEILAQYPCYAVTDAADLFTIAQALHKAGFLEEALPYLQKAAAAFEDATALSRIAGLLRRGFTPDQIASTPASHPLRLALLGDMNTQLFAPLVQATGLGMGFALQVHEAGFGAVDSQILDSSSELYQFRPDAVFVLPTAEALRCPIWIDEPDRFVQKESTRWLSLWEKFQSHSRAPIVQLTYETRGPDGVGLQHLGLIQPSFRPAVLQQLNLTLAQAAPRGVSLVDVNALAGWVGRAKFYSPKYWHLAKQPIATEHMPFVLRNLFTVLKGMLGISKRAIAVDLDQTLWGGILGEVGSQGVLTGQGDAVAEGFLAFQEYLKGLAATGVVLTLCTKNDEDLVRTAFADRRADMALHLEDFAAIRANWLDKPENIKEMAREIGLGTEHFVFIDDNPVECARMRQALPEIAVVCLPTDVADYPRAVDRLCLFERSRLTKEDLRRSNAFREDQQRQGLRSQSATLERWLEDLQMRIEVVQVDDYHLDRCVQLIAKSNQFNLTTRRHTANDVQRLCADPDWAVLMFRLRDRFGDNGWIGVMILHDDASAVDIDSWILSCRILGRHVEQFMLARAEQWCRSRQRGRLTGSYLPTAKNQMVKDLYDRLGFVPVSKTPDASRYAKDLADDAPKYPTFIIEEPLGATRRLSA